jgi:hypothetical protein
MDTYKWRLYGILNYSNLNTHYYYGTYAEVKNHCIWTNRNVLKWDFMVFEKVEQD